MENLTGWVCPKCGKVYSPFMPECSHCNGNMNIQPIQPPEKENSTDKDTIKGITDMTAEIFSEWLNGPKEGGE